MMDYDALILKLLHTIGDELGFDQYDISEHLTREEFEYIMELLSKNSPDVEPNA